MKPTAIYELSSVQQGMLMHSVISADAGVYISQLVIDLEGELNRQALLKALHSVMQRHEAIRSSFHHRDLAHPVQVVHPECEIPCTWVDWENLPDSQQVDAFSALLNRDKRTPFQLERPPATRLTICARGGGRYRILWTNHHILWDGWSRAILIRDFARCYVAALLGEELPNAPTRTLGALHRWRKAQDRDRAESYWKGRLKDCPETLLVSSDGVPRHSGEYGEAILDLSTEEASLLHSYARTAGTTPSIIMQAVWATLLHRITGNNSILFGVTSSGRPETLPEAQMAVGVLINTLPVRVDFAPGKQFANLVAEVHQSFIDMRSYEFSSLAEIQQWASLAGRSLFDSIFVYENFPSFLEGNPFGAELHVTAVSPYERTHYPLTLIVEPQAGFRLRLSYQSSRLPESGAETLLQSFRDLLLWNATHPQSLVEDTPILTMGKASERLIASSLPLNIRLADSLRKYADRIAIVEHDTEITYAELSTKINKVAACLTERGIGPENRVALLMDRGADIVAAIAGITLSGAAYVPLDSEYPEERLSFVLRDSGAKLLITDKDTPQWVPSSMDVVQWSDIQILAASTPPDKGTIISQDSALYLLYTSGSTGTPKGVCITHGNVSELLDSCADRFHFSENDCWTLFHSHAFDLSVWEMWGALLYGGKLTLIPFAISRSPADFWELLNQTGTTILTQTPSAFQSLIAEALRPEADWNERLRLIVFAGEALEFGMLKKWVERYSLNQTRLVNMYGITETTVHVTAHELTAAEIGEDCPSWIGGAIDRWRIHILDSAMHPTPDGLVGEIFVGGAGLARAYHGRPDLTAERFVPDPFGGFGERLYRSGDLAVQMSPGQLRYLGRGDGQVKIRGHRIELGEVEMALRSAPGVHEAVVIATREEAGSRLLAYIVTSGAASPEEVREYASQRLPAYMMPAAIVQLERLPLTINGKLDRIALPMPDATNESTRFVEPRNERERKLAAIWTKVLGLRSIGIHDNFFHSGGDSIRAMQVVSQANSVFHCQLPIRALYESPSIEAFSHQLEASEPQFTPIARAERTPLARKVNAK